MIIVIITIGYIGIGYFWDWGTIGIFGIMALGILAMGRMALGILSCNQRAQLSIVKLFQIKQS